MYKPTFLNAPELIKAIKDIGADAFLKLMLDVNSGHNTYLDNISEDMRNDVKKRVTHEIASALENEKTPMEEMYFALMRYVSPQGRNTLSIAESTVKDRDVFFLQLARAVMLIDLSGASAAEQVNEGVINWKAVSENAYHVIRKDPKWVAFSIVGRVCGRTRADLRTRKLIEASIGRIVEKNSRKDIGWAYKQDYTFVHHVVDWFRAALERDEPWLKNVDHLNRPKKLLKFGSFEALEAEVERQMNRRLNGQRKAKLSNVDERVVAENDDFWMVQLMSKRALEEESRVMRHCIGHGAYDKMLQESYCLLLSLRSKTGSAHCTIEVNSGVVVQCRGQANSDPKAVYREAIKALMPHLTWKDQDGAIHHPEA